MIENLDAVSQYFRGIKRVPSASNDDVSRLWSLARKGNGKARQRLVEMNLRLVIPLAKKYYRPGVSFLDLVEDGNLGLIQAVKKFDPTLGFRFSTYACYWIEQSIRRAFNEQTKTIRIPPHALESLRRWLKMWEVLRLDLGRNPTRKEMGKKLKLTTRQIETVIDAQEAARNMGSLDTPLDEDENLFVRDMVTDRQELSTEQVLSNAGKSETLSLALGQLCERERGVLQMRFGLSGRDPMTLEAVGKRLNLSRERVRQLEFRGLDRLRRVSKRVGLHE